MERITMDDAMKLKTKDILDEIAAAGDLADGLPFSSRFERASLLSLDIGDVDRALVYANLAVARELAKRS